MRREISSPVTIINKITVFLVFGILMPVFYLYGMDVFSIKSFILAGVYVAVGVLTIRNTLNLKKVEMIDTGLLISRINSGKDDEIFVPFEEIESVSTSFWGSNGDKITIKFRRPTRFGNKVYFSGQTRLLKFSEHPIIEELSGRAQNARFQAQIKMHHLQQ